MVCASFTSKKQSFLGRFGWGLPFVAAFLPIVLLTVYSLQIATDSAQKLIEAENLSATSNISQLLSREFTKSTSLVNAVAAGTGTITATKNRDIFTLNTRLKAIVVSYSNIDRAFVASSTGIVMSEYNNLGSVGSNVSTFDWFTEVKNTKKPYLSGVYTRKEDQKNLIAVVAPIVDNQGNFYGVLVFEYSVLQFANWVNSIQVASEGYVFILDSKGSIVAHPKISEKDSTAYTSLEPIKEAVSGLFHTREYEDPNEKKEMIATFMPLSVGSQNWVIVAQQPTSVAFSVIETVSRNIVSAGIILTLITVALLLSLARVSSKNIALNSELEEVNQSLKDFTSIVSHQLKAPITAMRWKIESMLDGDFGALSEEVKHELQTMYEVNKSNYSLVIDILNVSRLDRGVVEIAKNPISLLDIVERAIRDYKVAAKKAGLYLKIENPESDIMVQADLDKSAESITNAISNAIKHTVQGGITVKIGTRDDIAYVEVHDTGEGMSQEILDNLFSRDGIKKSNANAEHSSGLGLYIAREFMRMQGGDIVASSALGEGSVFTYTWKISNSDDTDK